MGEPLYISTIKVALPLELLIQNDGNQYTIACSSNMKYLCCWLQKFHFLH